MKIFKFESGDSSKFAYAYGYRPFEGMAFEGEFSVTLKESRRAFAAANPGPPGLQVGDTGSIWPDLMYLGDPPPSFVFSRKILNSLGFHGISLKRTTSIPIGSVASKKLRDVPPPDYFVIEALPGIRVDYAASGYVVDADGNPGRNAPRVLPPPILQYDPTTWSGADLFCQDNGHGGPRYLDLLFTERVKEIAIKDGWTNVSFQRVRVKGVNPITGRPD
jgi:hypothetical protein